MRPSSRAFPRELRAPAMTGTRWITARSRRCRAQHGERETRQTARGAARHGAREVRARRARLFLLRCPSHQRPHRQARRGDLRRQGREQSVSGAQEGLAVTNALRASTAPPLAPFLSASQEPQTRFGTSRRQELGKAQPVGARARDGAVARRVSRRGAPVSEGASPRKCATSPVGKQVGASIVCTPPIIDVAAVPSNDNPGFRRDERRARDRPCRPLGVGEAGRGRRGLFGAISPSPRGTRTRPLVMPPYGRAKSPVASAFRRFTARPPTLIASLIRSEPAARDPSASSAAIAPEPAEVIAWRYTESATSPAAKTPSGGPCLDASLVANLRRRRARCHCEERARFARSHALVVARGHKVAFGRGLKLE